MFCVFSVIIEIEMEKKFYFHDKYACSCDLIIDALAFFLCAVWSALEMTLHKAGKICGDISVILVSSFSYFSWMFLLLKPFKYCFEVKAAICVVMPQTRFYFWSLKSKDIIWNYTKSVLMPRSRRLNPILFEIQAMLFIKNLVQISWKTSCALKGCCRLSRLYFRSVMKCCELIYKSTYFPILFFFLSL